MSPRICAVGVAAVLGAATLLSASPAAAAPKNGDTFTAVCDGGYGTVQVIGTPGNGQGRFTPGFVIGAHQLGVPYSNGVDTKGGPGPKNPVNCDLYALDGTPIGSVTVAVHGKP